MRIFLWHSLLSYCSFDYFPYYNLEIVSGDIFALQHNIGDTFLGDRIFTKNIAVKFSLKNKGKL